MLPQLNQHLLKNWADLMKDRPPPGRLNFLGMRTRLGDGYSFFLAFADAERAPLLAVKIAREAAAAQRLQREWTMLTFLQQRQPHLSGVSNPQPILCEVIAGNRLLVTTAPQGRPLAPQATSPRSCFDRVGTALVQLACATRSEQSVVALHQRLTSAAGRLGSVFKLTDSEQQVVATWIYQWFSLASGSAASLFAEHGNLMMQNVWSIPGRLTIVNWEHAALAGPPLHDLLTVMTSYYLPRTRRDTWGQTVAAFQELFMPGGANSDQVFPVIVRYCRALDIPREGLEAYLGIFLIRQALQEYDRLSSSAERGYLPIPKPANGAGRQPYLDAIRNRVWINLLRLFITESSPVLARHLV